MRIDKKIVSPFEFAIMQVADPEAAKLMRAETESERQDRLKQKAVDFAKTIRIKK